MEIPVMTSASTHGLRSAVSACTKANSSYLNRPNYSGGCLKKITNTVNKSDGSSNELDLTKKRKSTNDCGVLCKKNKYGKLKSIGLTEEVPKKVAETPLNSYPNVCPGTSVPGELLSKIKLTKHDVQFDEVNSGPSSTSPGSSARVIRANENDSNNNDRKVNGSDFGAINSIVHNISISDVGRKTEECVDGELVNVNKEDKNRETDFGLVWEPEILVTRTTPLSRIPRAAPPPSHYGKNGSHQPIRGTRKPSKTMRKYDVFLGGSCNPTTWRKDIAIPKLKEMNISYYNPQVSQWRPDLLELEYQAKENSAVMFFVIDNQTRGVSTLVEVAHIAGSKRNLTLVIQSYTQEKQTICGEVISQREYEDLRNGQEVLRELVESQNMVVFNDIHDALKWTEKLIRPDDKEEVLERLPHPRQIELREAFDALVTSENGTIALTDARLALQLITQKKISLNHLKDICNSFGGDNEGVRLEEKTITFEQFASLASQLESSQESVESFQEPQSYVFANIVNERSTSVMRDVFLCGNVTEGSGESWKEKIAVPLLKKHGLTYFNPSLSELSDRFLPIEAAAMNNSYISLIVITNTARSIVEMAVASHYIGLGARVVLCIQHLPDGATICGEKLSESAVKDYNRGRIYLTDIAKRNGTKVFSDISEAVQCVIKECERR